jgi:hypothetical protein
LIATPPRRASAVMRASSASLILRFKARSADLLFMPSAILRS